MAVTSFAYSNAAFVYSGGCQVTTHIDTASTSRACLRFERYYAEVAFAFTGTQLDMYCALGAASGKNVQYRLDGGPFVVIPNNGDVWGTITIVSGLTDALHYIQIKTQSNNSYFYLDASAANNAFTVTGAAPAVSLPSKTAPFGFEVYSAGGASPSIYYVADTTEGTEFITGLPGAASVVLEDAAAAFPTGQWTNVADSTHNNILHVTLTPQYTGVSVALRFSAACSEIWVYGSANTTWSLRAGDLQFSHGTGVNQVGTDSSEAVWIKLSDSLQPQYPLEYTITLLFCSGYASLAAIALVNPNGSWFTANVPATRPLTAALGDSFTNSTAINNPDNGHPRQLAAWLGHGLIQRGVNGTTIVNYTGYPGFIGDTTMTTLSIGARASDITGIRPLPTEIVVMGGTNDLYKSTETSSTTGIYLGTNVGDSLTGGKTANFTPALFGAGYSSLINALVAGCPNAKILCGTIPPKNTDGSTFNGSPQNNTYWKAALNAAIFAAVQGANNPNVIYVDTVNTPLGTFAPTVPGDTLEGWHPSPAGYRKIVSALYQALVGKSVNQFRRVRNARRSR